MCDAHLLLINKGKEFSLVGLLLFTITLGILLRDTDVTNNPLGVGGLDFILKPCRQVHSAICNLSRAHQGPFNPLCALCISDVRGMSTQTSDPRCRDPLTLPSLLATDRKQFLQIIPMPALDGFHLVRLLSRGSRPRAPGVDRAQSSTTFHLTPESLGLETETSQEWVRRRHAAGFSWNKSDRTLE